MSHFSLLGQAVTIVSAAGFFEDAANPKTWVKPLFQAIPEDQIVVVVTNIQFRSEYIDELANAVQMRVEELHEEDIRTLMIFTASLLGLLSKQGNDKGAFEYLNDTLAVPARGSLRLRAAHAIAAAKVGSFKEAREDLAMIRSVDKGDARADSIETHILLAEGRRREAYELNQKSTPQEPGDWLLRATILEALASDPATLLADSNVMKNEALKIRARYGPDLEYVLEN